MATFGLDIISLYFKFQPVASHTDGCSRAGTDSWEATRFTWESFNGEVQETTFRFVCSECGIVALHSVDGPMSSIDRTHVSRVGFGSQPERVAGMWLHPGPLLLPDDGSGPHQFYVTRSQDRPKAPGDVTGVVGWKAGRRGGVHSIAGLGVTDYGTVRTVAGRDFSSKRAAVAWVSAQTAGESR